MLLLGSLALAFLLATMAAASAGDLVLYGAGSLHGAMADIAKQFDQRFGTTTKVTFGPSGMMRERIEKGEHVDIFTSADMGNARKLVDAHRAAIVVLFARNRLCGYARPSVVLTTENFLAKALDPGVKLGTSTPKADPGGDYTWEMFHKADSQSPGAFAALDAKAASASYGLTVLDGANPEAYHLALFILSPAGQETLVKYGFSAPTLP